MHSIKVQIEFRVFLTEEEEELLERLSGLFNLDSAEIQKREKERYTEITVKGSRDLLHRTKERIDEMQLQERVRDLFRKNRLEKKSRILLDKQAAYAGAIGLINSKDESSLGPVFLKVFWDTEDEFSTFLDWLTFPQTL